MHPLSIFLLGLHMIYAGLKPESAAGATDATRRRPGFWNPAATGLTTLVMVTLGIMLGGILGSLVRKRAEIIGATILHEHQSA